MQSLINWRRTTLRRRRS